MSAPARQPEFADISQQEDGSFFCRRFKDRYASSGDALGETRHVFLQGNRLPSRWPRLSPLQPSHFILGETGFGTGLNFLAAWRLWASCAPASCTLHYLAVERYPPNRKTMAMLCRQRSALAPFAEELSDCWPCPVPGIHRLNLGHVQLSLAVAKVAEGLGALGDIVAQPVDAWFLDGFAPARNPEMWTQDVFSRLARMSGPGTTFATYTAASGVREGLRRVGFEVRRTTGYGQKRHMLEGRRPGRCLTRGSRKKRQALVVGGGLAGTATAAALARRGFRVCLLEQAASLAQGASAQPRSVIYARLSPWDTAAGRLTLAQYQYALSFYRRLLRSDALREGEDGALCGALHLACEPRRAGQQTRLAAIYRGCEDLLQPADAVLAEKISGLPQRYGGLFFPGAGWLIPAAVCRALAATEGITLRLGCRVAALEQGEDGSWRALAENRSLLAEAETAVVASGQEASVLSLPVLLSLESVRGQSTLLPAGKHSQKLRTVLCHRGYLTPAAAKTHALGASFEPGNDNPELETASHQYNLERLAADVPALAEELPAAVGCRGRAGFRCVSRDRQPLAGPAGEEWPGLHFNLAHGGKGLVRIPLCAELTAAKIAEEPLPMEAALAELMAPARFGYQRAGPPARHRS